MPEKADLIVKHGHLLTMTGDGVGYVANGSIAIRDGRIVAVGPDLPFKAGEILDATDCAVLPGLIDAHMHTRLAIVRGVAQDSANWMQKALAPYARHITDEAALAGTRLNAVEALKAGTTTMVDYVKPVPGWAESFEALGVRARLTPNFNAMPKTGLAGRRIGDLYPFDETVGEEGFETAIAFAKEWHGRGLFTVMLGPQAPDMMPRELLVKAFRAAEEMNLMVHMHVAQGDREIDQMIKRYGQRTPGFLRELGLLSERLLAVHLTEATDEESAMIAKSGARMALCSGSIGIIDGIVPPARAFRDAGGLVALGSDQSSGNNCNNIFNEMKLTALFNKIRYRDPTVMPAWEVMRMATIEGARAVGLGDTIGSLEEGKQADLILVDLKAPNLSPVLSEPIRNIVPNLVYAGTGHEVRDVVVAGRTLMRDRKLLTVDESAIRAKAQEEAEGVARRVAADPVHRNMTLLEAMEAGRL